MAKPYINEYVSIRNRVHFRSDRKTYSLNLIYFYFANHSSWSGYSQLIHHLDVSHRNQNTLSKKTFASSLVTFFTKPFAKGLVKASGLTGYRKYNSNDAITEILAGVDGVLYGHQIYHFLYGEHSYRYLGYLTKIRNNKIIVTYHQPTSWFQKQKNLSHIRQLTAIIVVAQSQIEFFATLLGSYKKVFFVPHGVDITYFSPDNTVEKNIDCIFVGNHLRDFEVLFEVIEGLSRDYNDIRIVIISSKITTNPQMLQNLSKFSNVQVFSGLSDEQLRNHYCQSKLLLLPLLDCTANNTLLEAMACGLPVVSTDLPGISDYVNQKCTLLSPVGDSISMIENVKIILKDQILLKHMSVASIQQVKKFSWEAIALKTKLVYETVAKDERI